MQRKNVAFEKLGRDGVSHLVGDIGDCCTPSASFRLSRGAGPVQTSSRHPPNNYRSLHTGVIGPSSSASVQIRTRICINRRLGVAAQ
jgi:hypothetical protein